MAMDQKTKGRILQSATPALLCLLFGVLVWIPLEHAWRQFCFNNYDLGIYAQALSALSLSNLNPWLTVRELRIFSDHFDPVLLLIAPFKALTAPGLFLIRFEMFIALATIAPFFWLARQGKANSVAVPLIAAAFLFNRASLSAFYYPAHPGTWAVLPLAWTFAFLAASHYRAALIAFFFCLLCKEEYPAVGIAIAAGLAWSRCFQPAAGFALISAIWGILVFAVRPALLESSGQYTGELQSAAGLAQIFAADALVNLGKWLAYLFIPFAALIWIFRRGQNRKDIWRHHTALTAIAMALLALLGIRLAGGWWYSHRSSPVVIAAAFLSLALIPQHAGKSIIPRKYLLFAIVLIAACAHSALRPGLRVLSGKDFAAHCPARASRIDAMEKSIQMIRSELAANPQRRALVQGNLIPHLVDAGLVAHLGATTLPDESFSLLLVESPPAGNPWPLDLSRFDEVVSKWKNDPRSEILIDGEAVLINRR